MQDIYSDANLYDIINTQTDDIKFFLDYAKQIGGPTLELATGTGRIAEPLFQAGIDYFGLELSPQFVKKANQGLSYLGKSGKIVAGDMRNFDFQKKFDLIFIGFNSIFHLMNEFEITACLSCVHKQLSENGVFIIDMFVPNIRFLNRDHEMFYPVGKYLDKEGKTIIVKEKTNYDSKTEINHITWYVFIDGIPEPQVYDFNQYMIPPERIQRLLKNVGFVIKDIYGDRDKKPFNEKCNLQIYICQK